MVQITDSQCTVFLLLHIINSDADSLKIIEVYSSRKAANQAIKRLSKIPGFRDYTSGFHVDEYTIDRDNLVYAFADL